MSGSSKALSQEYLKLTKEPVEGFRVNLFEATELYKWEVALFGPPDTLYEGGYFKAIMKFPPDYPYSPPTFCFTQEMWHPNIYENGDLCISILHPPVPDPHSGELLVERWNPTQSVRTILLSVIALLNEPNTSSPANVDASVSFRRWKEGIDNQYEEIVKNQVRATLAAAEKDGVVVPKNREEYCLAHIALEEPGNDENDFYEGFDCNLDDDYDDEEGDEEDVSMVDPKCS